MCGIIGYIGKKSCPKIIFEGLKLLEYRGYDSAGIAVLFDGQITIVKNEGKLSALEPLLKSLPERATRGIGHTRWATHGQPSVRNAHPHGNSHLAVVHNGIIENYEELKQSLMARGVKFASETDTEIIVHLLDEERKAGFSSKEAILRAGEKLQGAYALGILFADEPDAVYLVKKGSPLVVGLGEGENFFASDALALQTRTRNVVFLNDGEMARVTETDIAYWDMSGSSLRPMISRLETSLGSIEKQGFRHFMLKEIHEQPKVLAEAISRFLDYRQLDFHYGELGLDKMDISRIEEISLVACGSAFYASLVGKYLIEKYAELPVNVELASEFRYRDPLLRKKTLVIPVSQSGETADTLACVKHALESGCQVYSVCNVRHSSITRLAQATLYMEAGPEIGVASTKAFTSMIFSLFVLGLALGKKRKILSNSVLQNCFENVRLLPPLVERVINLDKMMKEMAEKYYESVNCLFIGRGPSYPIALEGALKLKEISYIHAEGYAGGELKHGPIALVDRHMPIVALALSDKYYEKMLSNVEEVKARGGRLICVGNEKDKHLPRLSENFIPLPSMSQEVVQAIVTVVPLQLFAYYIAIRRGTDVDQPRNLAKSVTVE